MHLISSGESPHRLTGWARRATLLVGVVTLLTACALPRSGPYYSEVTALPEDAALDFEVVPVTPQVAALTRVDERMGFSVGFVEQPVIDTARIAPNDVMAVTVWENIDQGLLNPVGIGATPLPHSKVDERGNLFVPYVGLVRASGRTLDQLRRTIRARLAEQTLNPQVDVFPVATGSRRVSVQGRVSKPGLYAIEPSTERLVGMLAQAGGVTDDPEVVKLRLRRGGVAGEIWLSDLYDNPLNDVPLAAGDAIFAERDRRLFTALGAVARPATVPFPTRELSVTRALGTVGGLIDGTADPTGVFVFRREDPEILRQFRPVGPASGAVPAVYVIDLTRPGGMFLARDFMLRDKDTLYVTTAPFVSWQKVLQAISPVVGFTSQVKVLTAQ